MKNSRPECENAGFAQFADIAENTSNITGFISKPYTAGQLLLKIDELLKAKP